MNTNEEIQNLLNQVDKIALEEVEYLARRVLKLNRGKLHDFTIAMGSFFFTRKDKSIIYSDQNEELDSLEGYKKLDDFITKWDEQLKITGFPMNFTATSKIKTNW